MEWIESTIDKKTNKDNWICANLRVNDKGEINFVTNQAITKRNFLVIRKWLKESAKASIREQDISDLEKEFLELANKWKKETAVYSSVMQMAMNENYQKIIGKGEKVIPFILKELKREANHWFWALRSITGENPVKSEDIGDIKKMSSAWIKWGKDNGYII